MPDSGQILPKIFFWQFERGSWQYDLAVIGILVFVYFMPRKWLRDQPESSMPPQAQQIDDLGAKPEHEDERRHHRSAGAHGEITEHIEETDLSGKIGKPIEHRINLARAPQRGRGNIGARAP